MMTRLQWVVFIGLGVCGLVATVAYAETRTQAMAGAGVSNGTPLQAGYLNPALMITNERAVVFPSFTFEGADPHGVVDRVTEFQRDYKQLETLFSEGDLEEIQQAREQLASSFERIKGSLRFNASFYALASIPLEQFSAGLYVRVEPRLFTGTKLVEADHTLIENARSPNDLTDLRSSALVDRKSTRLNSSHVRISYAVFCLKKKNKSNKQQLKFQSYSPYVSAHMF